MKITRKQLRQIIKEETQRLAEDDYDQQWQDEMSGFHGKEPSANILPADFDDGNPHGDEAEMERGYIDAFEGYPRADDATADYDIGWEQGQKKAADNLERYGPDHTEDDIIHDKGFYEGKKMKITKRQLRRIIKEELEATLEESEEENLPSLEDDIEANRERYVRRMLHDHPKIPKWAIELMSRLADPYYNPDDVPPDGSSR